MARDSSGQHGETADLDQLFVESRNVRRTFEPQWFLNLAYYQGFQWTRWDGERIYEPALEPWRIKLVDNRILPVIRTEVAKMTKSRPTWVATPRSGDDEDIAASRMAEQVLEWLWGALGLTQKQRGALLWSRITGAGFWKVYWDKSKGDTVKVIVQQDGTIAKNSYGRPIKADDVDMSSLPDGLSTQEVAMGDCCVEMRSPFEMLVDPHAGDEGLESACWIGEEVVQSPEYVQRTYDIDLPADTDVVSGVAESRMPSMSISGLKDRTKGVKVREFWAEPGSSYGDKGKRVVWAGGQILYEGDNPYPWLPYEMFRGLPVPGRFWPDAITTHLISPQTELNKRKAQIAENAARIGNPPLLKSSASDFEWEGLPGEVVEFQDMGTPGSVPGFMAIPEMPGYIREDISNIQVSIQEISGQHEVTKGNVPPGVTAASAINLLQEQDDTQLGPDIVEMEGTLSRSGKKVLDLVHAYYSNRRIVKIAGEDGAWDIFDFRGSMLKGNTDIEVQAGSAMPRSKAAKQAAMQDLLNLVLQYGVQVKQRDLRKFFKDYEVGGLERMFADLETKEHKVARENRRLAMGEPVEVDPRDDHEFELDAHNEFRMTARFEALNPQIQQMFKEHMAAHEIAMAPPPPVVPPPGAPPGVDLPPAPQQNGRPQNGVPIGNQESPANRG